MGGASVSARHHLGYDTVNRRSKANFRAYPLVSGKQMMQGRLVTIVMLALVMTGCRAAARSTVATLQQKVTLTQSTFRQADPVAPRRADVVVRPKSRAVAAKQHVVPAIPVRSAIVRDADCGVILDLRQGNVSIAREPKVAFEKVSS
jgi:hypothetical protein